MFLGRVSNNCCLAWLKFLPKLAAQGEVNVIGALKVFKRVFETEHIKVARLCLPGAQAAFRG